MTRSISWKNSAGITFVSRKTSEMGAAANPSSTFWCVRVSAAGFLFGSGAGVGFVPLPGWLSGEPGDAGTAGSDGSARRLVVALRAIVRQVVRVARPPSFV